MSKKILLQIPTPCHEDWNKMTAIEKGKFCLSCQKKVIDFTEMTDREVISFFKKPAAVSVCGRFQKTQLNRDILFPKKPMPFIKYFFRFTLPAFLISIKAQAQKVPMKEKVEVVCDTEVLGKLVATPVEDVVVPEEVTVKGNVKDENGEPVYYATVMLKGTKTGTVTDSEGNFSLKVKKSRMAQTLVASYVGFATIEKIIDRDNYDSGTIILMHMKPMPVGEVVVVGGVRSISFKKRRPRLADKIVIDTVLNCFKLFPVVNSFRMYPNPASSGSTVMIVGKKIVPDDYVAEIINQNAQTVYSEIVNLYEGCKASINIPMVNAGAYFLKLTGRRSEKSYSEKVVIQ